jgi:hypothetical protein
MQNVIGTENYGRIRKFLLSNNILVCDESYSDGGRGDRAGCHEPKSKWYKFSDMYKV